MIHSEPIQFHYIALAGIIKYKIFKFLNSNVLQVTTLRYILSMFHSIVPSLLGPLSKHSISMYGKPLNILAWLSAIHHCRLRFRLTDITGRKIWIALVWRHLRRRRSRRLLKKYYTELVWLKYRRRVAKVELYGFSDFKQSINILLWSGSEEELKSCCKFR